MSAERNTTKEWGIGGDCWAIRRGEGNFKQNAAAGGEGDRETPQAGKRPAIDAGGRGT